MKIVEELKELSGKLILNSKEMKMSELLKAKQEAEFWIAWVNGEIRERIEYQEKESKND